MAIRPRYMTGRLAVLTQLLATMSTDMIYVCIDGQTGALQAGIPTDDPLWNKPEQDRIVHVTELTQDQYSVINSLILTNRVVHNPEAHGLVQTNDYPIWARILLERDIAGKFIDLVLARGFALDVNDGEETVLRQCTDKGEILKAMFSTDEDQLFIRWPLGGKSGRLGMAYFIYGNSGWDVIADCSDNELVNGIMADLEPYLDLMQTRHA